MLWLPLKSCEISRVSLSMVEICELKDHDRSFFRQPWLNQLYLGTNKIELIANKMENVALFLKNIEVRDINKYTWDWTIYHGDSPGSPSLSWRSFEVVLVSFVDKTYKQSD